MASDAPPSLMKNSNLEKLERSLKWERQKVNKKVTELILEKAEVITNELLRIGLEESNPNVLNSLLDRAFGKAAQAVVHEGNPDKPIIFMPASLMERHGIKAAEYTELENDTDSSEYEENGPAGMLIETRHETNH